MKVMIGRIFCGSLLSAALVCLLITTAVSANRPTAWPSWLQATSFGGSGDDGGSAVKIGADGSQYFAGYFSSSAQFGNTQLVSYGSQDVFLTKRDSSGTVLWAIQAGGSSDDFATELALDKAGNIYLTGEFYDSATFGSTDGNTLPASGNGYTIFLVKYNPSGVVAWVQIGTIYYAGDFNWGNGLAVEPITGTVYLAGISQTDTTFSSADGTYHTVPGNGAWHMVLAKYDTSGIFYWGESNAASPNSNGQAVAVDADANAYVVGWFEHNATFYSQDGNNINVTAFSQNGDNYPDDSYLVKYDSQGNAKWVNHIGGYHSWGMSVAVGPSGDATLVGEVGNVNYGDKREKTTTVTSQSPGKNKSLGGGHYTNPYNRDVVVATWDGAGVLKSALRLGGKENEMATAAAYDANGYLCLVGPFDGTFNVAGRHLHSQNKASLFFLQYSGSQLRRAAKAVNAGQPPIYAWEPKVSLDAAGNVFVTGTYQDTASFGDFKLQNNGGFDIFLAELGLN